ncbi:hypothetical protein [Methanobrevibacter curvatus]|uniref:hypothetical protein n=1 Tax=Methanobrevibacter curvatus TaxID=49547 RepID=UPI000ACE1229|nr:hypothetical protein [Methanobrevibacter curvatus]
MKNEDMILAYKGYFSYENYYMGLMEHKIIPLIRNKKNIHKTKIFTQFNYL